MKRQLLRRKAIACLLVLAMMFSFMGGLVVNPSVAQAEDDEFKLIIGNYRGLSQEVSVPVSVENAEDLVALEFNVYSTNFNNLDVAVKSVERGANLPSDAQINWSGIGHGDVTIGIYLQESSFSGDGELVRIIYTHNGMEQTEPQPIALEVSPASVTARVLDEDAVPGEGIFADETKDLPITVESIENGEITVAIMYGDMDKNEEVTINDAILALRASVGELELTEQLKDAGNVSRVKNTAYGEVTVYDALLIARYAVGLNTWFPVNRPDGVAGLAPGPGDGENGVVDPTIQPSKILIGDYELVNPRTTVGGDVTFTVVFPQNIIGNVRVDVGGTTNTEFMENTDRVNITMNLNSEVNPLAGRHEVSAYQYNEDTRISGPALNRFVQVVNTTDTPDLRITATRDTELDFAWNALNANHKVTIRQSRDGLAWFDAPIKNGPIKSTDTTATVENLNTKRGYYFKLKVDGGEHAGESEEVRFNRMTGDAIAEQAGNDLYVYILYTGHFVELSPLAINSFSLIDDQGDNQGSPNDLDAIRQANGVYEGVKLRYAGESYQDFTIEYEANSLFPLDTDDYSYVLSEDSVTVGASDTVNTMTVASLVQLNNALANADVEKIVLAADITLGATLTIGRAVEIDGNEFSFLTDGAAAIEVDADTRIEDLTFGGGGTFTITVGAGVTLTLNGEIYIDGSTVVVDNSGVVTGNSAVIEGINGATLRFATNNALTRNLTLKGDLQVESTVAGTFRDVIFDGADLDIAEDVTFEDVTTSDVEVSAASEITVPAGKKWTLTGNVTTTASPTFVGAGTISGAVTFSDDDAVVVNGAITQKFEDVTFAGEVTMSAAANYDGVTFKAAVASEFTNVFDDCTFDGAANVTSANVATFRTSVFNSTVAAIGAVHLFTPGNVFNDAVENTDDNSNYTGSTFNGAVTNTTGAGVYTNSTFNDDFLIIGGAPVFDTVTFSGTSTATVSGAAINFAGSSTVADGATFVLVDRAQSITGAANVNKNLVTVMGYATQVTDGAIRLTMGKALAAGQKVVIKSTDIDLSGVTSGAISAGPAGAPVATKAILDGTATADQITVQMADGGIAAGEVIHVSGVSLAATNEWEVVYGNVTFKTTVIAD